MKHLKGHQGDVQFSTINSVPKGQRQLIAANVCPLCACGGQLCTGAK